MNEQDIRQALSTIADQEIDNSKDLWPAIEKQLSLSDVKSPSVRVVFWKPALVFGLLFLLAAASYYIYRNLNHDLTIPQTLITEIHQTQQVKDLTVELDWVYLDAARASVGIRTQYPETSETVYQLQKAQLTTPDGHELPMYLFGGGGGGGGGGDNPNQTHEVGAYLNFDSSTLPATDKPVRFNLSITYTILSAEITTPDFSGQEEDYLLGEQVVNFSFEVPYIAAVQGIPEPFLIKQHDISFEIKDVSVLPSMTVFTLCYDLPENDSAWMPLVFADTGFTDFDPVHEQLSTILTDGRRGYLARSTGEWSEIDGRQCGTMQAIAPYTGNAPITLTVETLYKPITLIDENVLKSESVYFEQMGFVLDMQIYDYNQDLSGAAVIYPIDGQKLVAIRILSHPDTMDDFQAQNFMDARIFQQRWSGPWQFEIKVK